MSLNSAMVYRRTDRGLREVYEKSHQFTQSERLVLILLDGRLTVAGLRARLPSLDNERIERTIVKLEEAGLVEPMDQAEDRQAPGRVEEVLRLEPDVVAQFLEQIDLDPVTAAVGSSEDMGAELVRASVDRAAARLVQEEDEASGRRQQQSEGGASSGSDRSHHTSSPSPFTDHAWDPTEASSFAITTVNVPDRLDLQEERDRAETEEYTEQRRRVVLQTWMKRLLVVAVVIVFGALVYGVLKPVRDQASSSRVGARLAAAFKLPVKVAETEFRFLPSPRLILRGVDVGGEFGAEQVALLINWKDLWFALTGGQWVWGEATVAPMAMSAAQAIAAVKRVPAGTDGLPPSISTIRFESVQVTGSRLFPGRYEAAMRRGDDGRFGPLVLKELVADDSSMQLQFRPSIGEPGAIDFSLEARQWAVPVGPRTRWNHVQASGSIRGNLLEVSSYALTGFFGITTGKLFVAGDVEWVLTGTAEAGKVDVETVLESLRGQTRGSPAAQPAAMQGTAALNLVMLGRGATAEDAITQSAVAGPFTVRFAVLNGINLGLAATQGVAASGVTRFTEFGGTVIASAGGVRFEETGGRAGAMVARSNFTVAPDASIAGVVRVELGGQRVQAPMTLRISGTAVQPRFGR
jgi:hypothetical protein